MSRKFKIRDQDKLYFVTFTVIEWIDLFTRKEFRDIVLESLKFCTINKGLEVWAYCIMSSHLHLILGRNGGEPLEGIIRDFKKFTSKKILDSIKTGAFESRKEFLLWHFGKAGRKNPNNQNFQIWQQHSHPIELNSNTKITRCLNYIHQNPVKAGIVLSPEDYLYSSARNYAGLLDCLIDVILLE
ncbi:REP-associated tyrosine transposase [Shivajiella indica]|uniref:Transposase n=1 Tax=Shivajiella indica TaxID=872115 RepID=A0ABW5B7L9_9BACT